MENPQVPTEMNSSALPPTQPLPSSIKKSLMAPSLPPLVSSPIVPSGPSPRHSGCSNRGFRSSTPYTDEAWFSSIPNRTNPSSTLNKLAYAAELDIGQDTGEVNCNDPRAYAAKFKTYNEDNP